MPIRVAVADKDHLVAQAVARLLAAESDIVITGVYTSEPFLIRGLTARQTDVLVLDPIGLALGGPATLQNVRAAHPDVRVVVLTASQREHHLYAAVRAGVRGYISKGASISDVVNATRVAADGGAMLTPEAALRLMGEFSRTSVESTHLTPRQRCLLSGIVQGKTNREIAHDVHLTEKTVKNYMRGLFSALGVRDRTEAAVRALSEGLLPNEDWAALNDQYAPVAGLRAQRGA